MDRESLDVGGEVGREDAGERTDDADLGRERDEDEFLDKEAQLADDNLGESARPLPFMPGASEVKDGATDELLSFGDVVARNGPASGWIFSLSAASSHTLKVTKLRSSRSFALSVTSLSSLSISSSSAALLLVPSPTSSVIVPSSLKEPVPRRWTVLSEPLDPTDARELLRGRPEIRAGEAESREEARARVNEGRRIGSDADVEGRLVPTAEGDGGGMEDGKSVVGDVGERAAVGDEGCGLEDWEHAKFMQVS